jgi:hypothetical protein
MKIAKNSKRPKRIRSLAFRPIRASMFLILPYKEPECECAGDHWPFCIFSFSA